MLYSHFNWPVVTSVNANSYFSSRPSRATKEHLIASWNESATWPFYQCSLCFVFLFASWIRPRGLDTSARSVQPWQHRVRGGFAASPSLPCPQQPGGWSQSAARRPVKRTRGHRQNAVGICRWVHKPGHWTVNDQSKLMLPRVKFIQFN